MRLNLLRKPKTSLLESLIDLDKIRDCLEKVEEDPARGVDLLGNGDFVLKSLQITEDQLVTIYGEAHQYFAAKDYVNASHCFISLALFDNSRPEYWLCFAHSAYSLKKFEHAFEAYAIASMLDPDDPTPHFYAGCCLQQLNRHDEANILFEETIHLAEHKLNYHEWKAKIRKIQGKQP